MPKLFYVARYHVRVLYTVMFEIFDVHNFHTTIVGTLRMISHCTNCTLVQTVASNWYYSGQTGQISNTRCIFKCILYYNNSTTTQNLPLNSTSVVPTPKIQRTAILILERLGSPATRLIAVSIV